MKYAGITPDSGAFHQRGLALPMCRPALDLFGIAGNYGGPEQMVYTHRIASVWDASDLSRGPLATTALLPSTVWAVAFSCAHSPPPQTRPPPTMRVDYSHVQARRS